MGKSKLKLALAAEKGTDFTKLKEKRQQKAALKAKQVEDDRQQEEIQDDEEAEGEFSGESEYEDEGEKYGNGVGYDCATSSGA